MDWTTACPDWEQRIVSGGSLMPCRPLYPSVADAALRVFRELILVDVIGKPTFGEVTRQWVLDFVAAIFGSYDPQARERRIKEFFLLISKKNTKSTIAAGIMMTALILNDRSSAELIILAPTKEVADNSFAPARDMIKADPELAALMNVSEHTRTIRHLGTNATLKVVAAESESAAGIKASYILVDELWIFGKRNNAVSMLREAMGGLASRPEGFVIYLTTQSDEVPVGVFKQKLDYARDVRDGKKANREFLPLIYEFPRAMLDAEEHLKPENWRITNPNLGASVSESYLLNQFEQAKDAGEEVLRDFLAKHLNVEIGMSLRANRWAGAEFWLQAAQDFTLDDLISRCDIITVGADGGGLDDLLGMAVLGRIAGTRQWLLWNRAWCHQIALERRKSEAQRLRDMESAGEIAIVSRIGDDTAEFAAIVARIAQAGKLDRVGLDPLGIGSLIDSMLEAGVPQDKIIGVSQGYKLAGYMQTAERKLAGGELHHAGQALMTWCAGNARIVMRGNGLMVSKQESGKAKIDPLVATFNAVALMSENPDAPSDGPSVFFV